MVDVLIRRDRWVTLAGLVAITFLSWLWLFRSPMSHANAAPMSPGAAPMSDAPPMKAVEDTHGAEAPDGDEEEPEFP